MKILVVGNAPVVKPDDGQDYIWNETIQNWELVE
jgi:hypothetical protein